MKTSVRKTIFQQVADLRVLFLQENNCQIRYHACHERGWSDTYQLLLDEVVVGYGSIKGLETLDARDAIFEYFVLPAHRANADQFFGLLIEKSGARYIESQSNVAYLTNLLYEFSEQVRSDVILFADHSNTQLNLNKVTFRLRQQGEEVFGKAEKDIGDYVLVCNNEVVATGGFLLHYNRPFADIFMEVAPGHRKKGYGQYLVQELKKACYADGYVPAARCNRSNPASKATLLKAGFKIAGHMLTGKIKDRYLNDPGQLE